MRSTLHRHLSSNGLGKLPRAERETKAFEAYEPGFVVADRATRLAFVAAHDDYQGERGRLYEEGS